MSRRLLCALVDWLGQVALRLVVMLCQRLPREFYSYIFSVQHVLNAAQARGTFLKDMGATLHFFGVTCREYGATVSLVTRVKRHDLRSFNTLFWLVEIKLALVLGTLVVIGLLIKEHNLGENNVALNPRLPRLVA